MKRVIHIVKWISIGALGILLLLFASLLLFSRFYQDRVGKFLLQQVNNRIESTLEVKEIRFNVFHKFPKASLELRDVLLTTPPSYLQTAVTAERTDTLLFSARVFLHMNILDVIRKHYLIRKVSMENCLLHIYLSKSGKTSYVFWKEKVGSAESTSFLELREVAVTRGTIVYHDFPDSVYFKTFSEKLNISGDLLADTTILEIIGDAGFSEFRLRDTRMPSPFPLEGHVRLRRSGEQYQMEDSRLLLSGIPFSLSGLVHDKGNEMELILDIPETEVKPLVTLLPPNIQDNIRINLLHGWIDLHGLFRREPGIHTPTTVEIDFSISRGDIRFRKKPIGISQIDLSGRFNQNATQNNEASGLTVTIHRARAGEGNLEGRLSLTPGRDPVLKGDIKGKLDLAEVQELISLTFIDQVKGSASFDLQFSLPVSARGGTRKSILSQLSLAGNIGLRSVHLQTRQPSLRFESLDGDIRLDQQISLENLSFVFGSSHISATLRLDNFFPWFSGQALPLKVSGALDASLFPPVSMEKNENPVVKYREIIPFPSAIEADVQFRFQEWQMGDLRMENISGRLSYYPGLYMVQRFSGEGMGGSINGDGTAWMSDDQKLITNVQLSLSRIDITKLFQSFKNFGQDYITDRHLKGVLTGDVSARCSWVERWKIDPASLVSFGSFRVINGELAGFDPILSLSKFIEVSELKDIRFSDLENVIYIQDQMITIPAMDIQSNAFHISLSGTHSFDNAIDYHLKVRLSDLLARKARSAKPQNEEFGVVEEDELGQTSLYLSILGTTRDYRIAYDQGAARAMLRERFNQEGQQLRQIFREEFGGDSATRRDTVSGKQFTWSDTDSLPAKEGTEKETKQKPRFRVTWEDDTTAAVTKKKKVN